MSSRNLTAPQQPLVSVLTPVYNGGTHLAECIESVLNQTYQNWEYIIVNNCSTDRTLEIAADYARRDSRIRIVNNSEFVSMLRNHNKALEQISPTSKYCKFVQADDLLFPGCLSEMVQVAEAHPSVGIVTSYQLWGRWIRCDGLPYPSTVLSGREVCRTFFLQREVWFASVSGFLLRSDLVRNRKPFLNEKYLFADTEVYFFVLQDYDYGFVHQVLSMWRTSEGPLSSFAMRHNQWSFAVLYFTLTYGQTYLNPKEYKRCLKIALNRYYRRQGRELFRFREKTFWQYHRNMMREIGHPFSILRLLNGAISEAATVVFGPVMSMGRLVRFVSDRKALLRPGAENKCQKAHLVPVVKERP